MQKVVQNIEEKGGSKGQWYHQIKEGNKALETDKKDLRR